MAGGAVQSAELTVPGYVHDTYSAFYGLLHCSPVLAELGLDTAVQWAHFAAPVAAAVSPDEWRCVTATATAPPPAWPDAPPARRCRLARARTGGGTQVGTAFLDQMLGPVGAPGPGLAFARRARRDGLFDTTQLLLGPLEALCDERFSDPGRPGPAGRGRVARRCAGGPPRQRARRPHPGPGRPGARRCPCRSAARAGSPPRWPRR